MFKRRIAFIPVGTVAALFLALAAFWAMPPAAQAGTRGYIAFIGRTDYPDPNTGIQADQVFVDELTSLGYTVWHFAIPSLATTSADTVDSLNQANLVIIGRSAPSVWGQDPHKTFWNNLTVPLLNLNLWNERNNRMNWFNTANIARNNTLDNGDTLIAEVVMPDDPVFEGIDLGDGFVPWAYSPFDYIQTEDAGNATVLARNKADNSVLFARFEPGFEFYDGAGDAPEGPRSVMGSGNDALKDSLGGAIINFYNFTDISHQVYLNEIARLVALSLPNDAAGPGPALPSACRLAQNFPNPFNPSTEIAYSIREAVRVSVEVVDAQGRLITTLFEGNQAPGRHSVRWDGRDRSGAAVGSGLYFCRLQAGNTTQVRKMLLTR
jgi:hypothetical protein